MEVLPHYNSTRFMGFVPSIRKNKGEWWIVEVSLTGNTTHNAVYIAKKLKEYFEGKEGAIFICNKTEVLVLARMGPDEKEPAVLKWGIRRMVNAIPG